MVINMKAVINVDVPEWQIGQDVSIYFPDSMLKHGKCLLKEEQEAVEPYMDYDGHDVWRCGKCGVTIFHICHDESDEDSKQYEKFCRHCGREVKWNEL